MHFKPQQENQSGQTLIETLVAAFILVMGITAALGLATYSLNATSNIRHQTVGLGLAREGIEVVKNMRDTNWLKLTLDRNCYDFMDATPDQLCYKNWLDADSVGGFDLSAGENYVLNFDVNSNPNRPPAWSLVESTSFGLDLSDDLDSDGVLYLPSGGDGDSGYSRKIIIEEQDIEYPFDQDTGGRLKVTSVVWWKDRRCPQRDDVTLADIENRVPCSVVLQTYLTNWRTF